MIAAHDPRATALSGSRICRDGHNGDRWYFHAKHAVAEGVHLSGGERRVLAIAASLAVSNRPVDLGDAITGLDPDACGWYWRRWHTQAEALNFSRNLDRPTMSPVEDREKTGDKPDAAEPLERPRSNPEAPRRDSRKTTTRPRSDQWVSRPTRASHETSMSPARARIKPFRRPQRGHCCPRPWGAPAETASGPPRARGGLR